MLVLALDGRRVLRDRDVACLQSGEGELDRGDHGHRQERPEEPADRRADQQAEQDQERRDPDRIAHDHRDEDVALDELEDDVDAGDHEGQLRGDGGRDQDRRDGAQQRPDDRDGLGQGRDEGQEQR